jgi:transcriptional regulator with XRE-family HTH domain
MSSNRVDTDAVGTPCTPEDPESRTGPRLGYQLKRRRRLKGLRLVDVAASAGISPSLISKIEHNKISPSLSTLHRLARALDTSVSGLFPSHEHRDPVILKKEQRPVAGSVQGMVQWEGIEAEIIVPHQEHRLLEGFVFLMEPGGHSGGTLQHEGEECGYVLEGLLELTVAGKSYQLSSGESFFFHSDIPHSYRNPGQVTARVIWINTPPTF